MRQTIIFISVLCVFFSCTSQKNDKEYVEDVLKRGILERATLNIQEEPVTITSFIAERSAGDVHDFYSEGDYWWPDSLNLDGPYIRRDGETNPDNFVAHRHAMIRFSSIVGNLTSAYLLTKDKKYVEAVMKHVRAWFINEETLMRPSLQYAQAIKGIATGRGIGIIDTVHLMEVAQSLLQLEKAGVLSEEDINGSKKWFSDYLKWMSTHPYGIDEMNAKNNHGTCWVMQAAVFARYVDNKDMIRFCSDRYKEVLLPNQMAEDGSFPRETARTKPYGYSLFNLDAMATICQTLSTTTDNLWIFSVDNTKNMLKGIDFIFPYVVDKTSWPFVHDVMYWDEWPVAHPFLIFGALQTGNKEWLSAWSELEHFPETDEVIRNLPVRNPLLWI
ncbi:MULTISPECIES: alginate lyase family protein [Bacteroides]|uniref:alginate lyase family protein n=1 Tax=Bacteroides TaxID=816 RepID=UPI000E438D6C|nr:MULTISPECIES: alginate lyase family protein [Bacteroides]RGM47412.1 alginate lyase [Bacteroides sp. OM08-11]